MKKIKNVLLSGGTHGNEFIGAYFVKNCQKNPDLLADHTFHLETLLSNPEAHQARQRYVSQDLNRTFTSEFLQSTISDNYEINRSHELIQTLGTIESPKFDVIIDLHTTTSPMGLSLVLTKYDNLTLDMAAYLTHLFPNVNCYAWIRKGVREGFLVDMAKHGFAIEVGPIANNILDANLYFATQELVKASLDYLDMRNRGEDFSDLTTLNVFEHQQMIDFPRDSDGDISAMLHPKFQKKTFQYVDAEHPVFIDFFGNSILWEGHGMYPVFINEAAYYEKNIAFSTTQKTIFKKQNARWKAI